MDKETYTRLLEIYRKIKLAEEEIKKYLNENK